MIKKKYGAIIFDFDDTLIFSEKIKVKLFADLFQKKYGKKSVKKMYNSLIGKATLREKLKKIMEKYALNHTDKKELDDFEHKFSDAYRSALAVCPIIPCMDSLAQLKKKVPLFFIVSLQTKEDVTFLVEHCGLHPLFTEIYGGHKERNLKKIQKKYALSFENMLYIGDSLGDVRVTKKLGIPSIGVHPNYNKRKMLKELGALSIFSTVCSIAFNKLLDE